MIARRHTLCLMAAASLLVALAACSNAPTTPRAQASTTVSPSPASTATPTPTSSGTPYSAATPTPMPSAMPTYTAQACPAPQASLQPVMSENGSTPHIAMVECVSPTSVVAVAGAGTSSPAQVSITLFAVPGSGAVTIASTKLVYMWTTASGSVQQSLPTTNTLSPAVILPAGQSGTQDGAAKSLTVSFGGNVLAAAPAQPLTAVITFLDAQGATVLGTDLTPVQVVLPIKRQ